MTVHQLHYTSCEDGLDGIQGFQISAMTPGAPKQLVDLAVRASAYEVGPDLLARLDEADPSAFPVAFGYVQSGPAAALFQSRYIGSDFTGRTGNYFAHALLLEDTELALNGALPIDLWQSPTWVHTRQNGTTLPAVTALAPGTGTAPSDIREFLRAPGRSHGLIQMISAAQRVLGGGRDRLVLVVPDDHTAALWVAALCRSLPRSLGLAISFVTYTARPEDATVLVSCTTPDVRLPTYGDFTAVDLTDTDSANGDSTRYAAIMARLWESDGVREATDLADRLNPPLSSAELEAFAVIVECGAGLSGAAVPEEQLLLDAATLAVDRMPGTLAAGHWQRIGDLVTAAGGPTDLARWSEILGAAGKREPIPSGLLGAYYVAALGEPRGLWLPALGVEELDEVVEHAVLPALTGSRAERFSERLGEQPELLTALVRVLHRRLTDHEELRRLATMLTPPTVRLVRKSSPDRRIALLADLVLARDGQADRVTVLTRAVDGGDAEWWNLGDVLWPDHPSTEDAVAAVRRLPVEVLRGTGLHARITTRLIQQVQRDELGPKEIQLINALLDEHVAGELGTEEVNLLSAARMIDYFRRATPKQQPVPTVRASLELLGAIPAAIGDRMLDSIAEFTLRADGLTHQELLSLAMESKRFTATYRRLARDKLAKAAPSQAASMIVTWWSVPDARLRQQLINETLPDAIARRRAKHLDQIGDLLVATARKLPIDVSAPKGSWRTWWKSWRSVHESRGLLGLFGLRKGNR